MKRISRTLSRQRRAFTCATAALVLLSTLVAGQRGEPAAAANFRSVSHVKLGGTVVIDNVSGSLWTCGFNPYSSSGSLISDGILYEPLLYINTLTGTITPWLASSYAWSNGNRTITFTMRQGAKWSDGKPLTAADVVFTFNLMKRFSGLDLQGNWSVLKRVYQQGNKAVMVFQKPSVPFLYYLAGQNYILPQHIWSKIKNPVNFVNRNPVGSGPFLMSACSPQDITYTRNPRYWQSGRPYVAKVEYPAFLDNQPGNLYLAQGRANWGCQYIPNVKAYYLNRDPVHRHIWYPPAGDLGLVLNVKSYPFNILAVRKAISYAINRSQISRLGVYGYLPTSNQSSIVLPNFKNWYDRGLAARYNYGYNPARAKALLHSAGFKPNSSGIYARNGKSLSFSIINIGGYTDWVGEVQVLRQNLRQIGIDAKTENLSGDAYTARENNGNFQAAYSSPVSGPSPYYEMRSNLDSHLSAPIGQAASGDYGRFFSPAATRLLAQFATTTSSAQQHRIINALQGIMLSQVPFVPVLEGVNWYQYDTTQLTGWPTPSNPYANPPPCNLPDWEVVLTRVHLK